MPQHHYQLVHQEKSDEVIDGLQLVFIELPKFKPQTFSEKKMQVLWLRFLTEINENTLEAPEELLENPKVSEALKIVEVAAYTPEEMRAYDKFWDIVSTAKTLELARQQEIYNYELKIQQLEGQKLETARKLKAMNVMTIEQIAEITGLTAEEIEKL